MEVVDLVLNKTLDQRLTFNVFSQKTDISQQCIFSFSTAVTLKIRSRSPKSN